MALLNQVFQADQLPVSEKSFDPLPAGWYNVTITGAELKQTKLGNGTYINVRYDVTGPTHQGRVVFGKINISNQSQKSEEIGRQQLGELMRAIGLARLEDTEQLLNKKLQIKLSVKEDEYGIKNEVKGYKQKEGDIPSMQSLQTSAPAAAPTTPASSKAPWAK